MAKWPSRSNPLLKMTSKNFINTFFRYVLSGGTAAALHFYVLIAFMKYIPQINATLATTIAFSIACIVNYNIQYHWTFKVTGSHKRFFPRYISVTISTMGLNAAVFWYYHDIVHLSYLFSQFFATSIIFLVNFIINNFFTFKAPATKSNIK